MLGIDSLNVLTNNLSLSKNMKTLLFCTSHSSGRNVRDTKQPLNKHIIQLGSFIHTGIYSVHVIFIPLDVQKLSPLANTGIGTALIHHVHGKLSWSSSVIIYMCKKCPNTPVIRSLIYQFIFTPPPPL